MANRTVSPGAPVGKYTVWIKCLKIRIPDRPDELAASSLRIKTREGLPVNDKLIHHFIRRGSNGPENPTFEQVILPVRHENPRIGRGGEHEDRGREPHHAEADRANQSQLNPQAVEQMVEALSVCVAIDERRFGVRLRVGVDLAAAASPAELVRAVCSGDDASSARALKQIPEAVSSYLPSSWKRS